MSPLASYGAPVVAYLLCVAGLLGLVMGSFINCWAWRYMNGESVMKGRSHCTTCGHVLGLRDLVPLFSWIATKGKCRYCGARVSARYPVTELVCGLVFAGIVAVYGLSLEAVELMAFSGVLLFLSLTDIDDYLIPNGCIVAAIAIRVAYMAASVAMGTMNLDQVGYYAASGFGVGLALVVVVLVADRVFGRDSMGGGDLKLYFVAGLYFGWQQTLLLVIVSCIIGIVVAFVGARTPEKPPAAADALEAAEPAADDEGADALEPAEPATATGDAAQAAEDAGEDVEGDAEGEPATEPAGVLHRMIPFGPSIAASCVIVMLVGKQLIGWYLSLLG